MKKLILSAFLMGAMYTAQAQTNLTGTAATVRTVLSMSATEMSRQMYNDLQLNEGQYVKIKALNQARLDKFNEIEKMYANDAQMRDAKIKEVNAQLDQEFASILTPKQFTSYLEFDGRPVQTTSPTDSASSSGSMDINSNVDAATSATSEAEMKIKDDKIKMESGKDKVKMEDNKIKVESASGEMKMKNGNEKLKTESVKYKSSPSETKIITAEGKTKVEHDKVKTKTDTSKKKVKN